MDWLARGETAQVVYALLKETIERDRFPLSPRIRALKRGGLILRTRSFAS